MDNEVNTMGASTKRKIKSLVEGKIKDKLNEYESETVYKPFYEAILEKETIIKASLLQSLYTSFGMSIYEQMAIILAGGAGHQAERQYELLGEIDDKTTLLIENFCNAPIKELTKEEEIEEIRKSIQPGKILRDPDSTVDVFLTIQNHEYLIDITTVKPNKKEARTLRRKLLRWAAIRMSQNPTVNISTHIGIPYNPYYPDEYSRSFVLDNMHRSEVLVQNDLWGLFAGYDVWDDLLEIFNEIGAYTKQRITEFVNEQTRNNY